MKILISNDDGYLAPGIRVLTHELKKICESLTVVAPERNRSASSSSLTLENPLRATLVEDGIYYVDGTPTDCVHLALTGLLNEEPDMVVSGINFGANLGDDVIYSGTVAAAIEGRFLGFPALAVSLTGWEGRHYQTAATVTREIIEQIKLHPIPSDTILNINVPDLPREEIKGFKSTRLGNRHKAEPVFKDKDPRGKDIYWVGSAGPEQDAGPGTDFHAIKEGYVSVTPMHVDLTQHHLLKTISDWVEAIKV